MSKKNQNPNGANSVKPDPRMKKFVANYIDPKSDTFGDAYNSAKRAGYADSYAKNITNICPEWLSEILEDNELTERARENLKEFLDKQDNDRLKLDATKFTLERIDREKFGRNVDITSKGEKVEQPEKVEVEIVTKDEET